MKDKYKIIIKGLTVSYGKQKIISELDLKILENKITAIIGPSGCGKSTLLMAITRLLDCFSNVKISGDIKVKLNNMGWIDVLEIREKDLPNFRRRVTYVSQHPNLLPMSIFKNVAFPLILLGAPKNEIRKRVVDVLKKVHLWEEVKNRLNESASELSGGQQQRLSLARTLILEPEVLLLDEPTSFLDNHATKKIESLLVDLKKECTIIVVSHYLDQIKRLADFRFSFEGF